MWKPVFCSLWSPLHHSAWSFTQWFPYWSQYLIFVRACEFVRFSSSVLPYSSRNLEKPTLSPCEIPLYLLFELNRESPLHVSLFPVFEYFLQLCILTEASLSLLSHGCWPTTSQTQILQKQLTLPRSLFHSITLFTRKPEDHRIWETPRCWTQSEGGGKRAESRSGKRKRRSR